MQHLPVLLNLRGRQATVVGGGLIAARKTELLLRCEARVTVVAPALDRELEELLTPSAHPGLRYVPARYEAALLEGSELVIAATDSPETNAAVAAEAQARRIPVNVVDDAALSTFVFPAIIDRDPIVVAVATGGASPVLARRLREGIEALLPARIGALARFLARHRGAVRRTLPMSERRGFWERLLDGPIATRVLDGDEATAERELAAALGTRTTAPVGEVYLIGAGPGDPDLLTLRALQLLQRADVVFYDRLVPAAIVDRARRDAMRVSVGKSVGEREMTQERINELLVTFAKSGRIVARLKGGDPFVFGRGGEEIQALERHGIRYTVVPGITAALGAAASAAIPLTHRAVAHAVTLVSGHLAGEDSLDWDALARARQTVVFYMSVAHLDRIVAGLLAAGAPPERPVAFVERATLPEERIVRSTLSSAVRDAHRARIEAPALFVVGEVTAGDFVSNVVAVAREPLRGVA
jgi:uroporphyrin-III C-methyltransferase / precorrin-2 dehydrogenase / sirohydrochlorin ferrochelatase